MTGSDLPERIGAYRLERRLGRGGMGEVFLAVDERLGRKVAIKRVLREGDPAARERFRREARAAARLNHSAVVQIYDVLEGESGDAIVLEYAEGRTVREMLAGGLPPPALTVRLGAEIAEGLAAAHAAGLIHRDLKAENVVVTPEEHAKILDFGIARPFGPETGEERLTERGALLGTYHAMSPEQAAGGEVDARSDLFSLGVLLYEMLTGRSPFAGSTPVDTLKRVVTHDPAPLDGLRPDLPAPLSSLVERLLAKSREERPRSAREVAAQLREIAASPELTATVWGQEGWNDRSTDAGTALPPGRSSSALRPVPWRGRTWLLAAGILLAAGLAVFLLRGRLPAEPLRVAVLPPEVQPAGDPQLDLAASGVLVASLSALASLEGVAPLDPAQLAGAPPSPPSPMAAARSVAAAEVLAARLEGQGPLEARVSLRRIRGRDGSVLWAGSFTVPTEARDLRLLADAVAVHLRRAYSDRRPREGVPVLDVKDADYAGFLRLKLRVDQGGVPSAAELAELEAILRSSPRFLEAHLLQARVAQNLFGSTRDPAHLERGEEAVRTARALAPGDPRPLVVQLRLALAAERPAEARALLTDLERLVPGDPEVPALSSRVAESEGDLERAIADSAAAVERAPSWWNLFRLADLEARAGRNDDARRHLGELLARSPGNVWGLDRLGNLELLAGDPARAEAIYLDLLRLQPLRSHYNNLGLARMLLGRPAKAVEAYRQALELAPGHVAVLLNLADAELDLGHAAEAQDLYSQVLAQLEANEAASPLSPVDRMVKAQCLARLGRRREAVAQAQQTLRDSPGDPQVSYLASLVYALAGDRASALVNAEQALDKGVQPRWLTLSAFDSVREDPDFQALLRR